MNKLTIYEQMLAKRLKELPLPDEDMAWQDMKRRLDKGDDNGIFMLPFKKGCGLLALLFALIFIGLLWFDTSSDKKILPVPKGSAKEKNTTARKDTMQPGKKDTQQKQIAFNGNDSITKLKQAIIDTFPGSEQLVVSQPGDDIKKKEVAINGQQAKKHNKNYTTKGRLAYGTKGKAMMHIKKGEPENIDTGSDENNSKIQLNEKQPADSVAIKQQELETPGTTLTLQKDSVATVSKMTDTVATAKNEKQKKEKVPEKISYSAGVALWQRIDNIGPQAKGTVFPGGAGGSVNAAPKNNKLFDYVPSIYARMYKGNKWFLQTEFRYRAPQYERDLLYSQKPIAGPFGTTTATKIVSKTYYHQVPLTFNYFITRNWSAGAGVIWNKFSRAVTVEQIRAGIPGFPQQDSLLSTNYVEVTKADSNFTKYYFQCTIETQYRWKKLSLGFRYAAALQPYLQFTLPGGAMQKEKKSSLQLFLRYEWWKSKKATAKVPATRP